MTLKKNFYEQNIYRTALGMYFIYHILMEMECDMCRTTKNQKKKKLNQESGFIECK
jgi:hypothetical protein